MEVLNQNQRRSMIWRITALFMLILAMLVLIVAAMQNHYAGLGQQEWQLRADALQDSILTLHEDYFDLRGRMEDLHNRLQSKELEIQRLRDQQGDVPEQIQLVQTRLELCQDRNQSLDQDLTRCRAEMSSLRAQINNQ